MSAKTADEIQDELNSRYARFGIHPLTDEDVWALSMAAMVMPDGNPGAEAYLAKVAGTPLFHGRLMVWGRVVAIGVASARYKARDGQRRVEYVPGYDESWGRHAVADGLTLALYGKAPGLVERAEQLKVGKQGYQRIRDFVGGALVNAIAEYQVALQWATGSRRDRVLSGRWEGVTGLSWDEAKQDEKIEWGRGNYYPMFAPGCAHTGGPLDADQRLTGKLREEKERADPETLYRGLRPSDWWDDAYARQMRNASVTTISPATD